MEWSRTAAGGIAVKDFPADEQVFQTARRFLGIPFLHGGRDRSGLDCLGLIHLFYREFDIRVPEGDGQPYSEEWAQEDPDRYLRGIMTLGSECPIDDLRPLDLVYFRVGRTIAHAGVMVSGTHFIHVLKGLGVAITPLASRWRRRLAGARRMDIARSRSEADGK